MSESSIIRAVIVDDEELARDTIAILLEDVDDIEVVGQCKDGLEALSTIDKTNPDLVFLDVQMPGLTGLEVVEHIGAHRMPAVVFVTAYDEYAVKAFEKSALDYLVKPFSDDRFVQTLDRVRSRLSQEKRADLTSRLEGFLKVTAMDSGSRERRFLVRDRNSIRFVSASDIRWIEAAGDYVILHTDSEQHMIRETMAAMEENLAENGFLRIHRSTIVDIGFVRELKPYFHGDYMLYLKDGTELKLSRRYWGRVEEALTS